MPWVEPNSDWSFIPNQNPARHYRWIGTSPRRLGMWLRSYGPAPGYSLERGKTVDDTIALCERLGLPEAYVDRNLNRIVFGDNVLASIPREEHERRERLRRNSSLARLEASEDEFHAKGDSIKGVRTFKEDIRETAEKKKFHTREGRPQVGYTGPAGAEA